jgi:hypothetical protein
VEAELIEISTYPVKGLQTAADRAKGLVADQGVATLFRNQLFSLPDDAKRLLAAVIDQMDFEIKRQRSRIEHLEQHGGMGGK